MIIEPSSNNWWIDSTMTHHIARKCKLSINGIVVILSDVLYVPDVCRNRISISILDKKMLWN